MEGSGETGYLDVCCLYADIAICTEDSTEMLSLWRENLFLRVFLPLVLIANFVLQQRGVWVAMTDKRSLFCWKLVYSGYTVDTPRCVDEKSSRDTSPNLEDLTKSEGSIKY